METTDTPSAKTPNNVLILLGFVFIEPAYAQSNAQGIFDDTDTIGLIVSVVVLAAFFIVAAWRKKNPPG